MIQVALCPSEIRRISATDLSEVTAVVFDVLRATSSIITGLASGVEAIISGSYGRRSARTQVEKSRFDVGWRKGWIAADGFDLGNSPEEFEKLKGRDAS